ncbi:hypothetical protein LIER_35871 [Lithospermum erythrorhizon]|uniref:H(+)-transporting two-sector ATPase n=1 Tax=Lithospermum erythrorhizon TaxID=34254 RepID=A0AAV3NXF0_LITER
MRINPTPSGSGVSMLEKNNLGRVVQIIGPVLDVAFSPGKMPNIYNALRVKATYGLTRGMEVSDTGAALSVPVGRATLGRIFNVLGEPVDNLCPVDTHTTSPIHRFAPAFIS